MRRSYAHVTTPLVLDVGALVSLSGNKMASRKKLLLAVAVLIDAELDEELKEREKTSVVDTAVAGKEIARIWHIVYGS